MSDLERLNIILAVRDKEMQKAMDANTRRVERFAKKSQSNLSNTARSFNVMGMAAKAAAPLIAALGAQAVIGRLKGTIAALDDIGKTADKIGLTTDALQELRAAAESAGVAQGSLDSSLERFSKRIGEAVQGTGAAKKALTDMGLSARALADMGLDQALSVVADEMAKIGDPTERAARAAALFGREGVAMVNLMREGSRGMADMRREARELGIVIDESLIRSAEESQTKLDLMSRVIDAQLSTALINLAPLLVGAAQNIAAITTAVNDFLSINFDMPQLLDADGLRELAAGYKGAEAELQALTQAEAAYNANVAQYGEESAQAASWLRDVEAARADLTAAIEKQKSAEASLQSGLGGIADFGADIEAAREKARLAGMSAAEVERERIATERLARVRQIVADLEAGGKTVGPEQHIKIVELADEWERAEIAASSVLQPTEEVGKAAARTAGQVGGISEGFTEAERAAERLRGVTASTFAEILTGSTSARDAVSNLLGELGNMAAQAAFTGLFQGSGIFGSIGSFFAPPSFDGGGSTGSGPRVGGLDGKGGFMAMVHPDESIIDHTRGGAAPSGASAGPVNINVSVSGARGNSEISEMVNQGVRQGLQEYDRMALPRRVQQIQRDPRRIG